MRQRAFLLFLACVLLTALCVVLLPGRRRSAALHAMVRETQERISALGEEAGGGRSALAEDPAHLASLGLEGPGWPVLYPGGAWLAGGRASDPSLVSAVEPGQAELGLGLVRSAQHFLPATSLLLYDLGLGGYERELLQRSCNSSTCSLIQVDGPHCTGLLYSPFPSLTSAPGRPMYGSCTSTPTDPSSCRSSPGQ
jgi:hypothetical protein